MHCEDLIATPLNLGTSELISINGLVSITESTGGLELESTYDLDAPRGVAGRNSDNTFINQVLGWDPSTQSGRVSNPMNGSNSSIMIVCWAGKQSVIWVEPNTQRSIL